MSSQLLVSRSTLTKMYTGPNNHKGIRVDTSKACNRPAALNVTTFDLQWKALDFLYDYEESAECALLSSFRDDSNLNIFIQADSPQWGKARNQGIFHKKSISHKIMHPQVFLQRERVLI